MGAYVGIGVGVTTAGVLFFAVIAVFRRRKSQKKQPVRQAVDGDEGVTSKHQGVVPESTPGDADGAIDESHDAAEEAREGSDADADAVDERDVHADTESTVPAAAATTTSAATATE